MITTFTAVSAEVTLSLKLNNAYGTTSWKSSDRSIATVSSSGQITGKKTGKTTITATNQGITYTCTLNVLDLNKKTNNAIDTLIVTARKEIGYREKRTERNLDSKTANAGYNNYTKYARDVDDYYQGDPWCAMFISWCMMKTYGRNTAKKLLKDWPYVACRYLPYYLPSYNTPKKGDIVLLYNAIKEKKIDSKIVRDFLEYEGSLLSEKDDEHYYFIRDRFNEHHDPLDFLFLNRSCFNGMIRFNRYYKFNVPYGHKPERFAKAYVTKICNQVKHLETIFPENDWTFECCSFEETISKATPSDFIYCDPPYIGRHVDYYDSWDEELEQKLHDALFQSDACFIQGWFDHMGVIPVNPLVTVRGQYKGKEIRNSGKIIFRGNTLKEAL